MRRQNTLLHKSNFLREAQVRNGAARGSRTRGWPATMTRLLMEHMNGNYLLTELGRTQVTAGRQGRQCGKGVNGKQRRVEINRDLHLEPWRCGWPVEEAWDLRQGAAHAVWPGPGEAEGIQGGIVPTASPIVAGPCRQGGPTYATTCRGFDNTRHPPWTFREWWLLVFLVACPNPQPFQERGSWIQGSSLAKLTV